MTDYMTGAELQTLREACGLSRDELGARCGVQGRSIKYWETGAAKSGVPADVADTVIKLDAQITRDAAAIVEQWRQDDVLIRFSDPVKSAAVSRAFVNLRGRGLVARIVTFDRQAYGEWLERADAQDKPEHRAAWARQALKDQARPHRADQPPL